MRRVKIWQIRKKQKLYKDARGAKIMFWFYVIFFASFASLLLKNTFYEFIRI